MKGTLSHCSGCRDNFYNGNNPYGVQVCWNLKSAVIKKIKFVPWDMRPPWNVPAEKTNSCHSKKGYVAVSAERSNHA